MKPEGTLTARKTVNREEVTGEKGKQVLR